MVKDANGRDSQSERNRAAYLRRKRAGYYSDKLKNKTAEERAAEAETKRAWRHANGASPRSTNAELETRRRAIQDIARAQQPATVRAIFYQAVVAGIVGKSDYKIIQADLVVMRQNKVASPMANSIPMDWIVDTSRRVNQPLTFSDPQEGLVWLSRVYRRSLWDDADCVVQVWLEKDALSGVLSPITRKYDVPLMTARGFSSISFIHESAKALAGETRPVYVYHFGDHDAAGVSAGASIERDLRDLAPGVDIYFKRLAVTEQQIRKWKLPIRPNEAEDTRAEAWGDRPSVDLDAIEPNRLRKLAEDAITKHLPRHVYEDLMVAEEDEQRRIRELVGRF